MSNKNRNSKPVTLKIVGLILSESYQRCKNLAQRLHRHHRTKYNSPHITGLLDVDWMEYLNKLRKDVGGQTWAIKHPVVVFWNGYFLGSAPEMMERFKKYEFKQPSSEMLRENAKKEYLRYLSNGKVFYVFMELSADGDYMGSLLFQLRHDLLPKTCRWFAELCQPKKKFTYQGTTIHRICQRGWFQAGMIRKFRRRYLEDENYAYKHDRRGILSFAKEVKNMNQFEFFVTFESAPWMDGKYVAFGRLVEGYDVLRRIENTQCTYEHPDIVIKIENCGIADVQLGSSVISSFQIKGITVGEPHLDIAFFIDLIFEKLSEIIFERLDEEVKKQIEGEWIKEWFWGKVMEQIGKRYPPVEDVLDEKDRSSLVYLTKHYLAGLYGPPDIPDHYIKDMLNKLLDEVIDRSDITRMAASVVNMIVRNSLDEATDREMAAEEIINQLIRNVFREIYGTSSCPFTQVPSRVALLKPAKNIDSSISEVMHITGLEDDVPSSSAPITTQQRQPLESPRGSVEDYISELLFGLLQNISQYQFS